MSKFDTTKSTEKARGARDSLAESDASGRFVRVDSTFREIISVDHPTFKPEADRYHLYISFACPWANGVYILMKMKGLDKLISHSVVHPSWGKTMPNDPEDSHTGWVFRKPSDPPLTPVSGHGSIPCDGCVPDNINNAQSIRDLYILSNDTSGKYTVPVLWDKHKGCIVNNESQEILRMFNSAFNHLLPEGSPERNLDMYPPDLVSAIDEANSWIYPKINNGVYRCGFAKSQCAYNEAVTELYEALDRAENVLSQQRYIASNDRMTGMDLRLFMTLVRFDEVYVVYFKCNKRMVSSYPNIRNFMRELYQHPVIGSGIHMDHIKYHYFTSHPSLNTYSVVPVGMNVLEDLALPHDRGSI